MPLYEFRCPSGHDFEKFYRSIGSAPPEEKCPECGITAERRMSAAGLVFKGSGFYITDYGKDGKKPQPTAPAAAPAGEPAAATAADAPAAPGKSDTKPAATESKPATTPKKAE
jgi:putative FmdB family regulatory protein